MSLWELRIRLQVVAFLRRSIVVKRNDMCGYNTTVTCTLSESVVSQLLCVVVNSNVMSCIIRV
jgi:hypothetical protein